jgi:hypothetical protein
MLNSTSKTALSFLLCLCLLFNKIKDKGIPGSAWKQAGRGRGQGCRGEKCVFTCELMNKKKKKVL